MRINHRIDRKETLFLSLILACGVSAPHEALAASDKLQRPLTPVEQKEFNELVEHSPLAQAIDTAPTAAIKKKRAKSQIPLLHGFYELDAVPAIPRINKRVFTEGMRIYFDIPDAKVLSQIDYTSGDIQSNIDEIMRAITSLPGLQSARRVAHSEDSNTPFSFFDATEEKTVDAGVYNYGWPYREATASFFPLGMVHAVDLKSPTGKLGGVRLPLVSMKRYDDFLSKGSGQPYPEGFKKFIRSKSSVYESLHEILHTCGFWHSPEKDHILTGVGTKIFAGPVQNGQPLLKGASIYTHIDGKRYFTAPAFGDIQDSPVVDLLFFLDYFGKQQKDEQGQPEKKEQL